MSAVVSIKGRKRTVNKMISQMFKDMGIKLKLCQPHSPQTKGKCESANRFRSWIPPYDGELESIDDIRDLIDNRLTRKVNERPNGTTGITPDPLYQKEMEYLTPLPSNSLLDMFLNEVKERTVPSTLLVQYKELGYSVPKAYMGRKVRIHAIEKQLFIYCGNELIATHSISDRKINYHPHHYEETLEQSWRSADEIKEMTRNNLSMLQKLCSLNEEDQGERQDSEKL